MIHEIANSRTAQKLALTDSGSGAYSDDPHLDVKVLDATAQWMAK